MGHAGWLMVRGDLCCTVLHVLHCRLCGPIKKNQQLYIRDRKSADNCYVTEAPDGNSVMQKP